MDDKITDLIEQALLARKRAYAVYSKFQVGAALLTKDNKIYSGFNIENSSYSVSICAERSALVRAVCDGHREFKAIAVVGGKESDSALDYCPPCGVCRQALMEFCDANTFKIILAGDVNDYKSYFLKDMLPFGFGPENIVK